ncbi:hypothetical protein TNCV_2914351 [Trichonephila clavipes]|nr:hypothetical protein TNCV_2914351 [Trichonephila clavipes]
MDGMCVRANVYSLSQEKTTSPYFQGVFSRDTLPPLQQNMCAIVNSDDSSQPGTHWKKFVRQRDLKRHSDSVHSTEKIVSEFCDTPFTRKENLLHHLNNRNCERKMEKKAEKRKRVDMTVSSKKKKTQLSTSAENSAAAPKNYTTVPEHSAIPKNSKAVPEKIFLPPKEKKEETIFIFRNELKTYKALKETNLVIFYDDMSKKIVKESEDFEGKVSGWTLDEILRLNVDTNRYCPFRGSSSFIEVPKQIAKTKANINVINKKDSVFHVVYSRSSLPQHQ